MSSENDANEVVDNESEVEMGEEGSQIDDSDSGGHTTNGDEADTEVTPPHISECNMTQALAHWESNHTVSRFDPVPVLKR